MVTIVLIKKHYFSFSLKSKEKILMNYDEIIQFCNTNFEILEPYVKALDKVAENFQINPFKIKNELSLKKELVGAIKAIFEMNIKSFDDFLYSTTLTSQYDLITLYLQENIVKKDELKNLSRELEKIVTQLCYIRYFLEAIQEILVQDDFKFGNITVHDVKELIDYNFNFKVNIKNLEITPLFFQIKSDEDKISILSLIQLLIDDTQYCIDFTRNIRELVISKLIRS